MNFKSLQKWTIFIDSLITILALLFFIIRSIIEKGLFLISYNDANIYAILFIYVLGKISIGFIIFIALFVMYKKYFIKPSLYIIIPWSILTILILILNNIYGTREMFIYIIIISVGIIIWNKVLLYKIEFGKKIKIIYNIFSTITNYLLMLTFYVISRF
jgi:hypothetical protein